MKKYIPTLITFLITVMILLNVMTKETTTSNTSQSNVTSRNQQEYLKDIIFKYKNALDDKIVDFQVCREPLKHLFTLYDAETNPNAVKYRHWIEYDIDTDSLILNDYLDMDGSVEDIENEIKDEYLVAKGVTISDTMPAPSHVTIKLYLVDGTDNSDIIKNLAEYKDGRFITNRLSEQEKKYKGKPWYYKEKDLSKK